MKRISTYIFIYIAVLTLAACSRTAMVPESSSPVKEQAEIFPDYRDIIIPPNIAPLNIQVNSAGSNFAGTITAGSETIIAESGENGKLFWNPEKWGALLEKSRGKDMTVQLYAERDGAWVSFPSYKITVAQDTIDRYLSYRLIEPSYQLYRQMGLYQRDLETFEEFPIYENNREFSDDENHCVNCHNFQNHSTKHMLFHIRGVHGGTLLGSEGKLERLKMTTDSTLGNAVYPSWHPSLNCVAFSSNDTGQAFHMLNKNKIEVIDRKSDLIFFDADNMTISNILKTNDHMETFPCWAPDGKTLYYCDADVTWLNALPDSTHAENIVINYDSLRYDLMRISFDPATKTFGTPEKVVSCASQGMSAAVPRVSPDGRYIVYTRSPYGQFHIWHSEADLWLYDIQTGEDKPLDEVNSKDVDSYHSWSSNGRWIVVASRRIDGSYSRPFIAYFDRQGKAHKAFLLPQEDPEYNQLLMKSFNVPELTRDRVPYTPEQLKEVIYNDDAMKSVKYK